MSYCGPIGAQYLGFYHILTNGMAELDPGLYPAPWVLRYSRSFLQVTTLAPVTPSPARITDWLGLQKS